jgi:AraC-like DNA-binding protein
VLWLATSVGLAQQGINWRMHFALVSLGWLLLIPLASAIHWGTGFTPEGSVPEQDASLPIHTTMLLSIGLFAVQTVWTINTCFRLLRQRANQNHLLLSTSDDLGINTLKILLLIVLANAVIVATRVLYCALLDDVYFVVNMLIIVSQLCMVIFLAKEFVAQQLSILGTKDDHLRRSIGDLSSKEVSASVEASTDKLPANLANAKDKAQYQNSGLSKTRRSNIMRRVEQAMEQDKLFEQAGLSLNDLCKHIGHSPHHVSEAIHHSHYQNFYDLVNQRRIALATELLKQHSKTSLLEIGFACGFNSKSSFNSVFKKYQNTTPSQYRAKNKLDLTSMEQI